MQQARPSAQPGEEVDDTEGDAGRALVRSLWNYALPWQEAVDRAGHGTVGAVARDAQGRFAVAVSTGGSPPSLLGRVADTPLVGCGFYAGPHAAIACSGIGEHVVRNMLAVTVYRWIEAGMPLREALERGMDLLPEGLQIGLIGIDRAATHVAARKPMASATRAAGARG
jgi:beta-aspartyl-peptidase (threonine type)